MSNDIKVDAQVNISVHICKENTLACSLDCPYFVKWYDLSPSTHERNPDALCMLYQKNLKVNITSTLLEEKETGEQHFRHLRCADCIFQFQVNEADQTDYFIWSKK